MLRSARPEVRNDFDQGTEPLFERDPALLTLHRRAGTRHLLTVPLFARGEPLGAITLTSVRPDLRFGDADVAMAEDLARLVVAAIDTGLHMEDTSISFFSGHLEQASDEGERKFLGRLIEEEREHYRLLADLRFYYIDPEHWFMEKNKTGLDGAGAFS